MFIERVNALKLEIEQQIKAGGYPFPSELIQSLIQYESGGNVGAVNPKSGASGLMQVMPGTLDTYNRNNETKISLDRLRSKSIHAAGDQIKVGLWVLGRYWKKAFAWIMNKNAGTGLNVDVEELARFGDGFYAAGPGRVKEMAAALPKPLFWHDWTKKYPDSNITKHADRVWSLTVKNNPSWDLQAIDDYVTTNENGHRIQPVPDPKKGFLISLLIIALAVFYFFKDSSESSESSESKEFS